LKKRSLTTLTRLLDYGGLAEITFKAAGLTVLTLYILSLTGITLVDLTVSNLGILMMRATLLVIASIISYIVLNRLPPLEAERETKKKTSLQGSVLKLLSLFTLSTTMIYLALVFS
jgi:hypothetical protein